MNESKPNGILLESGTNELGIMEFTVGNELFGINVAKIREILRIVPVKPMQKSHTDIEGVFKPRDKVLTVINLASFLGLPPSDSPERDLFMVTNFNNQDFAFHVHTVVGINTISWEQLKKPDSVIYGGEEGVATAIAEYEGRLITVLDFEAIVADISPVTGIQVSDINKLGDREKSNSPILIVEDSMLLSKLILESLHKAGYVNLINFNNGHEAWDYINQVNDGEDDVLKNISCIISDIEMSLMDGHRLTKLVKENKKFKVIPIILFSSLISKEMRIKGQQLGADEQITKPEIAKLIGHVDRLTGREIVG